MLPLGSLIPISTLTLLTFTFNILLLFLTYRMKKFTMDVKYIIGLAISDSIPFIIVVTFFIILLIYKNNLEEIAQFRQWFGFLEMLSQVLSAQFTLCLAIYRISIINQKSNFNYWSILPCISSGILLILLIIISIYKELILSPSAFISQPYPTTSRLSAFVFYHLFLHVFLCNIATVTCYLQVVFHMSKVKRIFRKHNGTDLLISSHKVKQVRNATIKGWLFITTSGLILIPGVLIFLIEGHLINDPNISSSTKSILATLKASLFIIGGMVNSLFVLFYHNGIHHELKILLGWEKPRPKSIGYILT